MNPNQIKIDTYKELIEWLNEYAVTVMKLGVKGMPDIYIGRLGTVRDLESFLKGRIEELEK